MTPTGNAAGTVLILLEAEQLHLCTASTAPVLSLPWDPDAPEGGVAALRGRMERARQIVLVVGLGFLELARPTLPPVTPALRRRMLRADRDRYFTVSEPVAVGCEETLAWALPAARLAQWHAAFGRLAPIVAVLALPRAMARAGCAGEWTVSAASSEHGWVVITEGVVRDARRVRGSAATTRPSLPVERLRALLTGAPSWPPEEQLLDEVMEDAWLRQRQSARWRAGAIVIAALLLLGVAIWQRQQRMLERTSALATQLETQARDARAAQQRWQQALQEAQRLEESARMDASADAPLRLLARISRLLPPDVVVQRLEWDGEAWRLDGSATDAAALVPRLDADPVLADVRLLAPSARYVENGRVRSSFAIGFRTSAFADTATTGTRDVR